MFQPHSAVGPSHVKKSRIPTKTCSSKMIWQTLSCSNETFNHGYIRRKLCGNSATLPDEVYFIYFIYEQLFHPVQCTA